MGWGGGGGVLSKAFACFGLGDFLPIVSLIRPSNLKGHGLVIEFTPSGGCGDFEPRKAATDTIPGKRGR